MTEFIIRFVRFAHLYSLSFQNYALFAYLSLRKVKTTLVFDEIDEGTAIFKCAKSSRRCQYICTH